VTWEVDANTEQTLRNASQRSSRHVASSIWDEKLDERGWEKKGHFKIFSDKINPFSVKKLKKTKNKLQLK